MTQSVYIIGGAGSGKSTFMNQLMDEAVMINGPLVDLHSLRNAKALVTLRGHEVFTYDGHKGLYIGCIRDEFPGTDGLDRASSPVGEEWLKTGAWTRCKEKQLPEFIIAEGATLATRRFLGALNEHTDLLLVHLTVDPDVAQARFDQRGSKQNSTFVKNTVTRSRNLYTDIRKLGACTLEVDTADPDAWVLAMDLCRAWFE